MKLKAIKLKQLILCSILVLINMGMTAQNDLPHTPKPGKCYAKSIAPIEYEEIERTFYYYIGDRNDEVEFDSLYFDIEAHTGSFIYLGAKADLNSEQIEQIEDFVEFVFLKDSLELNEKLEETLIYKRKVGGGGIESEWTEVLCNARQTVGLIKEIEEILIREEYLEDSFPKGILNEKVREALSRYQKENGLPIGNLNIATLEALGIY